MRIRYRYIHLLILVWLVAFGLGLWVRFGPAKTDVNPEVNPIKPPSLYLP